MSFDNEIGVKEEPAENPIGDEDESEDYTNREIEQKDKKNLFIPMAPQKQKRLLKLLALVKEHQHFAFGSTKDGVSLQQKADTIRILAVETHKVGLSRGIMNNYDWKRKFFGRWRNRFIDRQAAREAANGEYLPPIEPWETEIASIMKCPTSRPSNCSFTRNTGTSFASATTNRYTPATNEWPHDLFGEINGEQLLAGGSGRDTPDEQSTPEPSYQNGNQMRESQDIDIRIKQAQLRKLELENELLLVQLKERGSTVGGKIPNESFNILKFD